jgi:hypothetical protein
MRNKRFTGERVFWIKIIKPVNRITNEIVPVRREVRLK